MVLNNDIKHEFSWRKVYHLANSFVSNVHEKHLQLRQKPSTRRVCFPSNMMKLFQITKILCRLLFALSSLQFHTHSPLSFPMVSIKWKIIFRKKYRKQDIKTRAFPPFHKGTHSGHHRYQLNAVSLLRVARVLNFIWFI